MNIEIKYFGITAEKVKMNSENISFEKDISIQEFREHLLKIHPELIDTYFRIAIDQNLVEEDFVVSQNSEVALLPAFAGG